ncbi:MAG: hypothetical protein NTX21_02245 [Alphaproteobacteria bacterium]|nr:hypothetical protein [Alphaproteobacteria bacterium]
MGLVGGEAKFFALYTRKAGWVTAVDFKPNLEIRDVYFTDPLAPPDGCTPPPPCAGFRN